MTASLKVDDETDRLVTTYANFLGITKRQFVAEAVSHYAAKRVAEVEAEVKSALISLDGSQNSAVKLLTGMTFEHIEELGGIG